METKNHIFTVDTQVMGEPLRLVTGGIPFLKGSTVQEKMAYFEENFDHFRTALMLEPRGHNDMFGAVLCEPVDPEADAGIFFMHSGGYLNMCGHGTIGAVTTLIEMGLVNKQKKETMEVILETPVGLVVTTATLVGNKVESVAFENVPSFVLYSDLKLAVPGNGEITLDIAYGGNFFGIVSAGELDTEIEIDNLVEIVSEAMHLRDILNDELDISHPIKEHVTTVDLIEIYEHVEDENPRHKNCVIFGKGQVDRSPCGSGTCAMMAVMHHKDELRLGESFYNDSIVGTTFVGKAKKEVKVGSYNAIVPEVKGKAFITGIHHFIIDSEDPLREGFSLHSYG